ncbi:glycerate kinase [Pasteurellaceae bacterium Pebbles2]|nr:glycerate kinase [Pasteurellaceae bacterium Pebbles2]
MKIVIAPDFFKESLTAREVAEAIECGFKKVFPEADYIKIPMADGGEGTTQSLIDSLTGELVYVDVTAPLGNQTKGFLGISGDKQTAIIEMAAASGLHLVPYELRNPLNTTSFGTGELIKAALDLGVKNIILGIGGSATNDGGAGMLQALGAKLLDNTGSQIPFGGKNLLKLDKIDLSLLDARLWHTTIQVACDVANILCGEQGASFIFGPQKGADGNIAQQLDRNLWHFSQVVKQDLTLDIASIPGSGAGGGIGAGLMLLPKVKLQPGIQIVIQAVNFLEQIKDADLIITGEGRMDSQSIQGKTPIGIAQAAKSLNKPVIAIVGCLEDDYEVVYQHGIDAVFPILRRIDSLSEALKNGSKNLVSTAQNVAKLIKVHCI